MSVLVAVLVGAAVLVAATGASGHPGHGAARSRLVGPRGAGPVRRVELPGAAARRSRRAATQVPDLIEALASSMRSGATIRQALEEVAGRTPEPLVAELDPVTRAVRGGVAPAEVLAEWSRTTTVPAVPVLCQALTLGLRSGGPVADALDGLARSVRDQVGVAREVHALGSQARASAVVIVTAPVAFGLVTGLGDASSLRFLVTTPAGWLCLALGIGLDVAGGWWMHRLARSVR